VLRPFRDLDRPAFYELNRHPLVVESLGPSPTRSETDALVDRLDAELRREGWGLWAVEVTGGDPFIGMVGLHRVSPALPCAPAVEVAWRLHPDQWGHGYASEAAAASLGHGFRAGGLTEIVAFTTTVNMRSQAVTARLGMERDAGGDFDHPGVPEGSPLRRHVLFRISAVPYDHGTRTRHEQPGPASPTDPPTPSIQEPGVDAVEADPVSGTGQLEDPR
jgi:RimJ/RimL family protein N-acetyltransferase